ncbi:MAG: hypothetical protein AUK47_00370 [Deltaproteobacteria bacterium CG2_30_63_29]|nr:MAG: hypothetical protein AUK47_00370 [Deltaproteobacteria bacterium CG2_30_63_29]PJB42799.1 MAG: hypothetical protein CO108_11115 [Deltaproteobacteria bacterium CG_4_9_14_3_um_filter_63_12]
MSLDIEASPADSPTQYARTDRIASGRLWRGVAMFGLPMVVGMVLYGAFNLIDMFMLSRLENAAQVLAALGVCDMVFALASIVAMGISNGSVALIARRAGEGDREGVREAAWQSLLLMTFASVAVGLVGILGANWVATDVMQMKGEVARLGGDYLQVMLGGAFSMFLLLQVTAILRALGHARSAASLLVAGNALNVLLNAVLIYGTGPHPDIFAWAGPVAEVFGVPRLGMVGAAWATLIGRTVPVIAGAVYLTALKDGLPLKALQLKVRWALIRELLRLGWPSAAQLVLRVGVVLVFLSLVAASYTSQQDATVLTAYSICLRLEVMVLFMSLGWGAAASTYVAISLGANRRARAINAGFVAALCSVLSALLCVALFQLYAESILGFFDPSPAVVHAGKTYLTIVGWSYLALAFGVVLSQGMAGAGATLSSFVLDALVLLSLVIPASLLVVRGLGLDVEVLWVVIASGNVLAGAVYGAYFRRGTFLEARV